MSIRFVMASIVALSFTLAGLPAAAIPVFDQGFETDTAGWFDGSNGWSGSVNRVASGTTGITSFAGSFHAIFAQGNGAGGFTGPFTRFDGYRDTYPGAYSALAAIYLDTSWAPGSGFDYSVASTRTDGTHLQDFIFHITQDTSSGQLLVGASNNTNFDPIENLETVNHVAVATSGWYIFEQLFRNNGGQLEVDMNLYDNVGALLFTETRIDPFNQIPAVVGGNRYGWLTNIDVAGGIAVDQTRLNVAAVPEPGSLALLLSGLAAFGFTRRRKAGPR